METVKQIFEKYGYSYDKDGRNRTHRSLQKLLDSGFITFRISSPGKVFVSKTDGVEYNIKVYVKFEENSWRSYRFYHRGSSIDGYDVLKVIGMVLQEPKVKEVIKSYVDIDSTCQRCNGVGRIPMFHYYCDGICFECFGLGYNPKHRHTVEIVNA